MILLKTFYLKIKLWVILRPRGIRTLEPAEHEAGALPPDNSPWNINDTIYYIVYNEVWQNNFLKKLLSKN